MENGLVDWKKWVFDDFRDQLFRSKEVKDKLWHLKDRALDRLSDVLEQEISEKNISTIFMASKYVIDSQIVPLPEISHQTIESSGRMEHTLKRPEIPEVSKEELIEASRDALRSEIKRPELLKETNVIEADIL